MRLETTVTGYHYNTKVCSYCCDKVSKHRGKTTHYTKCIYCDYSCYDMFTYNKYYYNNETLFCSNKVYSNVDYSYFYLIDINYPIDQTNVLNVNINKNTCSDSISNITLKINIIIFLIMMVIWTLK